MPLGASKITRKRKASAGNAEMRRSGSGQGGGGPESYGEKMLAGHAKKPEPKAAPSDAYVVKQKARNT